MSATPPPKTSWAASAAKAAVAAAVALIGPKIIEPQGSDLWFYRVGLGASLLGFTVMWIVTLSTPRKAVIGIWAGALFLLAVICLCIYSMLLYSPAYTSPGRAIQLVELALFAVWWFGFFALLCCAHRIGGKDLIDTFQTFVSSFGKN